MVWDVPWKRLPWSFPFPSPFSDDDEDAGIGGRKGRRRSSSYYRLPEAPLRLSVLKLDGSSFDVQIGRTACVGQLKVAIERVFNQSLNESGGDISWSLVWSHFCLCYNEQQLIDDKVSIERFQIKDGDQLRFIRHLSVNHKAGKRRSRVYGEDIELNIKSSTGSLALEEVEENAVKDNVVDDVDCSESVDSYKFDQHEVAHEPERFKWSHLFRGWFSYSRLKTLGKVKSLEQDRAKVI